MKHYDGKCDCESVQFTCDGEPLFTQYCHCNKCREVASPSQRERDKQGYAWTAAYLTSNFHVQQGADSLDEVIKNNAKLFSCKSCHCLIYGISVDPAKQAGIGINAQNFILDNPIPESFKAVRHVWYTNRIIDFDDDLPKFKDAPIEQGGKGEKIEGATPGMRGMRKS